MPETYIPRQPLAPAEVWPLNGPTLCLLRPIEQVQIAHLVCGSQTLAYEGSAKVGHGAAEGHTVAADQLQGRVKAIKRL